MEKRGHRASRDLMGSMGRAGTRGLLVFQETKGCLAKSLGLKVELQENPGGLGCQAAKGCPETLGSKDQKA